MKTKDAAADEYYQGRHRAEVELVWDWPVSCRYTYPAKHSKAEDEK